MNIEIGRQQQVTVIEMDDRVDARAALVFAEVIAQEIEHGHYDLVLDMAGVDYIGSAGLRQLMSAYHQVRRKGGDLRLARPNLMPRKVPPTIATGISR